MDFDGFDSELMTIKKKERIARRYWKWEQGGAFVCPFALVENIVFTGSCDYYMYGIDIATGKKVWRFKTDGVVACIKPEISDGIIYLGSGDMHIYAVYIKTRTLLWRFKTGGIIDGGPAISGDIIYTGSQDGYLYALDKRNGNEIWRFKAGDMIRSKPAVFGNLIFFGSFDGFIYCLDKHSGNCVWRFKTDGNVSNAHEFLIDEGVIFVSSHDGFLYAIECKNGHEIWRCKTGPGGGTPSLLGNLLIFGGRDGVLYAIDKIAGREIWRCQTERGSSGFASNKPAISNDSIYIGSSNNKVYSIDHSGKLKWEFSTEGPIWNGVLFADGKVLASSQDCKVYCIDAKTGKEIWRCHSGLSTQPEPVIEDYSPIEIVVEKSESSIDSDEEEAYSSSEINFLGGDDEYHAKSEYAGMSEYASGSDYK